MPEYREYAGGDPVMMRDRVQESRYVCPGNRHLSGKRYQDLRIEQFLIEDMVGENGQLKDS